MDKGMAMILTKNKLDSLLSKMICKITITISNKLMVSLLTSCSLVRETTFNVKIMAHESILHFY